MKILDISEKEIDMKNVKNTISIFGIFVRIGI